MSPNKRNETNGPSQPVAVEEPRDDFNQTIRVQRGPEPESEEGEDTVPAPAVSRERADRFYDKLRERIHGYLEATGKVGSRVGDFLLLVPDMFMLLWRLANDRRVTGKNKVLLGSGLAYYLFPLDIVPEGFLGPIGYLDDLIFAVYMLNKLLTDTDPEVLREHWSGEEDVLQAIQRVLHAADSLVEGDLLRRLRSMK